MCSTEKRPPHIEIISTLVKEGKSDAEITNQLIDRGLVNLDYDEVFWEEGDVKKVRHQYSFAQKGMKLCPECKSEIREKATVCRYCKAELETVEDSAQVEEVVIPQTSYQKLCTLGVLISFSIILHIIFCTWRHLRRGYYSGGSYRSDDENVIFWIDRGDRFGIFSSDLLNGNVMLGLTFGVLLPMLLLGVSAFLYVGWHEDIKQIFKKFS